MRIQFCGADRTVTGSSHLLEVNGLRVFLDMGLFQGPRMNRALSTRACRPMFDPLTRSSSPMAISTTAANFRLP